MRHFLTTLHNPSGFPCLWLPHHLTRRRSEIGKDTEFKLTCWDKDTFSQDDFLGQFSVDMKGTCQFVWCI